MKAPAVPDVRLPKQARSQASFDRMLAAALELIAEEGLDGATVQRILDRSGTGAGTFYARFDSRDALLGYLAKRFWADTRDGWATVLDPARWAQASVAEIVRQFARMLVLWSRAHGALLRAFLVHAMSQAEPELLDLIAESDNQVGDVLITLLMMRSDRIAHPNPEQAIRLATLQMIATLRSRGIFAWDDRGDGIGDESLSSELATAFLRYIGAPEVGEDDQVGAQLGARTGEAQLRDDSV